MYADYGFRGGAEYRANMLYINPLDLSSEDYRKFTTIEHRLRLDTTFDYRDKVRLTMSADVLDGTLWGDNGDLGTTPEPTSGANVNTQNTNNARLCVKQTGPSSVDANSYTYAVCPGDSFTMRRAYGDVVTPIGLFRIGRQPTTEGAAIALNDGDGRKNRFGFANRGTTSDRVLFATKPLEAFKSSPDTSTTRGTFFILAYDQNVLDKPQALGDDLRTWITAIRVLEPDLGGGAVRDFEGRIFHGHRWDRQNGTAVNAFGSRLVGRVMRDFFVGFDAATFLGTTREVSEAFAVITNDPVREQAIRQFGVRAVARYDRPKYTAYLEFDYASGDSDPQISTPLTQFRFADDTNVGLLMFKHALAYQTARASAAAIELLKGLKAPTIPAEAIASRGAFTNALAVYPQADFRPVRNLLLRGGMLVAWAPARVYDPVQSQQRRDGVQIQDDLINFAGGKPGTFYGVELDGRVQYRFMDHFIFDLEGALFFPGDVFQDIDGKAARSMMIQGRTTFVF